MYINIYVCSRLVAASMCVHLCVATGRMGNKIISILNAFTAQLVTVCEFMACSLLMCVRLCVLVCVRVCVCE